MRHATRDSATTSVLIAHEHKLVRQVYAHFLEAHAFEVIETAADAKQALTIAANQHPSIVLVPDRLPDLPDDELVKRLTVCSPSTQVVLIGCPERPSCRQCPLPAIFVNRECGDDLFLRSVRDAARGLLPAGSRCIGAIFMSSLAPPVGRLAQLTVRERQTVALIAEGHTNASAAAVLGISARTAEGHRLRAMQKIGVLNTAGLIAAVVAGSFAAEANRPVGGTARPQPHPSAAPDTISTAVLRS